MPILPTERDPRLTTIRRGGTLTDDHHWMLAGQAWIRGELRMRVAHQMAFMANPAALGLPDAAEFAALSASQAIAVAHAAAHGAQVRAAGTRGRDPAPNFPNTACHRRRSCLVLTIGDGSEDRAEALPSALAMIAALDTRLGAQASGRQSTILPISGNFGKIMPMDPHDEGGMNQPFVPQGRRPWPAIGFEDVQWAGAPDAGRCRAFRPTPAAQRVRGRLAN